MSITALVAALFSEWPIAPLESPDINAGPIIQLPGDSAKLSPWEEADSLAIPERTQQAHDSGISYDELSDWAASDPVAALAWTESVSDPARWEAIKAVMAGASHRPDASSILTRVIGGATPTHASEYGPAFISALIASKQYSAALQFASTAAETFRENWLAVAFEQWARCEPAAAVAAWNQLSNPHDRGATFPALLSGWDPAQIAGLGRYVLSLPPGNQRECAFDQVLSVWGLQDPTSLAQWLNHLKSGPEVDRGAAWLVMHTDNANASPEVSLAWVEAIGSPQLRMESAKHAVSQWMAVDSPSAFRYVQTASWLSPDQRNRLFQSLTETRGITEAPQEPD